MVHMTEFQFGHNNQSCLHETGKKKKSAIFLCIGVADKNTRKK